MFFHLVKQWLYSISFVDNLYGTNLSRKSTITAAIAPPIPATHGTQDASAMLSAKYNAKTINLFNLICQIECRYILKPLINTTIN